MPIDASIISGLKPYVKQNVATTPFEQFGQQQEMMNYLLKNKELERTIGKRNLLANIYQNTPRDASGNPDFNKLTGQMYDAGLIEEALAARKNQAETQSLDMTAQKAKIESGIQKIDYLSRLFSGVKDQAGQDAAIQEAEAMVPGSSVKIPKVYSPGVNDTLLSEAMTHKDNLAQHWKEMEFDYQKQQDTATLAETKRGHDITREVGLGANAVVGGKQMFEAEQKLAADHQAESKIFETVRDAHSRLSSALPNATKSAASTLAGATTFMKLLDPGSVVRESELGLALQATGAIDRMTNYYNVLQNGKVLTPSQAKDFQETGDKLFNAAKQNQEKLDRQYAERAKSYGMNPKNVITNYSDNKITPITIPEGAITQTSPSTGKKRYSIDGGATWIRVP